MFSREKQNQKTREAAKKAWERNDIPGLLKVGFDNFMTLLCDVPIPFQTFLDYTSQYFDEFIRDCEKKEALIFIGGTMTMEMKKLNTIQLQANFYFQNQKKEWVLKSREGIVGHDRFTDWSSSLDLINLQKKKQLQFPIDPPARK